MPNNVRQHMTVYGPARDVAQFVMQSQHAPPRTGDQPGSVNYIEEPLPSWIPFHFHGIVPLPDAYAVVPYDNGKPGDSGWEMEVETWGQKWGPYWCKPETDIQVQKHRVDYQFTTAWGIPRRYYQQASLAFPLLTFAVSWGGEGPCFGRALWQRGEHVMQEDGNPETLPDITGTTEEEEETSYQRYKEAEAIYLRTHAEWVDMLLGNAALEAVQERETSHGL